MPPTQRATGLAMARKNDRRRGNGSARRRLALVTERPTLTRLLLAVATAAAVAAFLVDWTPRAGTAGLELGDIAPGDVRAQTDFDVVDADLTQRKQEQAREGTPVLFEYDVLLSRNMLQRVDRAFADVRGFLAEQGTPPPPVQGEDATASEAGDPGEGDPEPGDSDAAAEEGEGEAPEEGAADVPAEAVGPDPVALERAQAAFQDTMGVQLREVDAANLSADGYSAAVQRDIKELVRVAMSDYIVLESDRLPTSGAITVQRIEGSSRTEFVLDDFRSVVDLTEARDTISRTAAADFSDRPPHLLDTVVNIARALTEPNLRFNASETEVRRELAASAVAPITTNYRRGQVIVRSGEPVGPWALKVIDQMNAGAVGYRPLLHHLSLTLFLSILLAMFVRFAERFLIGFRRRFNDLLAMSGLLLFVVAISALLASLSRGPVESGTPIPPSAWGFVLPIAVGGILLRTLLNSVSAATWSVVAGLCCAAVMDSSLFLAIFYVTSALAAIAGLGAAHERGRLIRAGLIAALVNVAIVVAIDFVDLAGTQGGQSSQVTDLTTPLVHIVFALAGGVIAGVLAVGLAPLFETLGFVTDSKLLELSSLNHPLMREMIVKAPGTYHHSMMVGSLAESAAEAVGANSLLVRVGAYFHDIGKSLKPQYFIENQRDQENIHDRLSPSMSALVIVSHVKEGIELGRRHKLPEPIIDMIPQHHGTSLVGFFYNKAVQQADPDKGEVISDSDYRYPGPKPQTKEAALMMLADGVEAATRSLKTHTQGAITARVEKIVNKCVVDGQLDECPLTLRDLHIASETFVKVLMGMHHHRIEYPTPQAGKSAKGRGLPASSITLELPPLTPNPDNAMALAPADLAGFEEKAKKTRSRAANGSGKEPKGLDAAPKKEPKGLDAAPKKEPRGLDAAPKKVPRGLSVGPASPSPTKKGLLPVEPAGLQSAQTLETKPAGGGKDEASD
ncbi:MAG: HDIG domain-containing protein [Deltaproteobacteria bacterium]|nr:HDIG domain-containing protein [Deltaproteobacteria bacterium]